MSFTETERTDKNLWNQAPILYHQDNAFRMNQTNFLHFWRLSDLKKRNKKQLVLSDGNGDYQIVKRQKMRKLYKLF